MLFDHIGVIVADIEAGREFLTKAFQIDEWTEVFTDPGIRVYVQFGRAANGPCYELIAPLNETSPVSGALRGSKNILAHTAYLVEDIEQAAANLRELGSVPAGAAQPAVAYGDNKVQFFITPLRFMVELIEAPKHEHAYKAPEKA